MAGFFVGQRVRVVGACEYWTCLIGKTGVLSDSGVTGYWKIVFDDGTRPPADRTAWGIASKDIEPLTNPGHTAISIEALLSTPGLESLESIFQDVRSKV